MAARRAIASGLSLSEMGSGGGGGWGAGEAGVWSSSGKVDAIMGVIGEYGGASGDGG